LAVRPFAIARDDAEPTAASSACPTSRRCWGTPTFRRR
jgi:hypothetical protein